MAWENICTFCGPASHCMMLPKGSNIPHNVKMYSLGGWTECTIYPLVQRRLFLPSDAHYRTDDNSLLNGRAKGTMSMLWYQGRSACPLTPEHRHGLKNCAS